MTDDMQTIRQQFSVFSQPNPPVYLDSAATAQTPEPVIEAMNDYYHTYCGNVHRGMHQVTERATLAYEEARKSIAEFIGAMYPREIVFTGNCTAAINLVSGSWGVVNAKEGDTIILSRAEHHSNIVPWQQLAARTGCQITWLDLNRDGQIDLDQLASLLNLHTVKLVALTGLSNVLGTGPDLHRATALAHEAHARILIDAAQLVAHQPIDVGELDCDFLTFSGHKLYGPTGIGVLYAKREILEDMPPLLGGGMMIREVREDGFTPEDAPARFEAGTPPIAEAIGLQAACQWLSQFDWNDIAAHEQSLITATQTLLSTIEGTSILGPSSPANRRGCISFTIDGVHPHDLTDILGQEGVALRAGHHCAQPLHDYLGIPASSRVSFGIYNTTDELDILAEKLTKALSILR